MTPTLKVKFRKRRGIPFSIERLSGVQYRCRACNKVFLKREELEAHLESQMESHRLCRSSGEAPKLGENLTVKVLYALDLLDNLKKEYFRSEQDEYGEPWE
jgi:hypothetical protein